MYTVLKKIVIRKKEKLKLYLNRKKINFLDNTTYELIFETNRNKYFASVFTKKEIKILWLENKKLGTIITFYTNNIEDLENRFLETMEANNEKIKYVKKI